MAAATMEKVRALASPGLDMGSQAQFRLSMLRPHKTAPFRPDATFPYSASTIDRQAPLESPLDLKVNIDPPHESGESGCWRSGETVTGRVTLTALQEDVAASVLTLQVRCYCESRTLFWKVALPFETDRPSGASPAPSSSAGVTPSLVRSGSASTSTDPNSTPTAVSSGRRHASTIPAVLGHDFHRGTADLAALVLAPVADPVTFTFTTAGSTHTWDFSMVLPSAMPLDESSLYTDSLGRRAPRDLSNVVRSLPPTFRESRDASVEWICEATLRLSDPPTVAGHASPLPSPPLAPTPRYKPPRRRRGFSSRAVDRHPADSPLPDAVANPSASSLSTTLSATPSAAAVIGGAMVDDQGFKLSRPPLLYVARAVFPFMPSDCHVRAHGRFNEPGSGAGPGAGGDSPGEGKGFGSGLLSKPETGGTTLASEDLPFDLSTDEPTDSGAPAGPSTIPLRVFDKKVSVSPALGQLLGPRIGTITSRLLFPISCSAVVRTTPSVPLTLHLSHTGFSLPGLGGVGGKVVLEKVCLVLSVRIVTRGGAEPKPHISLTELRRQTVTLQDGENVVPTTAGGSGKASSTESPLVVRMRMALQGPGEDGKSRPCASLPPSFRTPNIELEYILTVNVFPKKLPLFCAARFPLQLLAGGDFAEPPPFSPHQPASSDLASLVASDAILPHHHPDAETRQFRSLTEPPPPPPHPLCSPLPPTPDITPPGSPARARRCPRPPRPTDLRRSRAETAPPAVVLTSVSQVSLHALSIGSDDDDDGRHDDQAQDYFPPAYEGPGRR